MSRELERINSGRAKRPHESEPRTNDVRSAFRQDRDRILYSHAFRRLSGITQVVPPREALLMHNRMIHSLKVGQVSRGIADHLLRRGGHDSWTTQDLKPFLDADVAEFAGLAHDLGHPPFGHAAEQEIQRLTDNASDSFEGNAQTFRILSYLAHGSSSRPGLNLTRASLRAVLKYPWPHNPDHSKAKRKWCVYQADAKAFEWVMQESDAAKWADPDWIRRPDANLPPLSLEAQIMDWADDVTYAVHDLEDFIRVGVIPLRELMQQGAPVG